MSTTSLNRFGSLNSAVKNPNKAAIESIALGVAAIRSVTDNQLNHRHIDMDALASDLARIDREIREWTEAMGVRA
jgi:hypothetical protein